MRMKLVKILHEINDQIIYYYYYLLFIIYLFNCYVSTYFVLKTTFSSIKIWHSLLDIEHDQYQASNSSQAAAARVRSQAVTYGHERLEHCHKPL